MQNTVRIGCAGLALVTLLALDAAAQTPRPAASLAPEDGQHAFDWEIGTWDTQLKLLKGPLTGSTTWVEYRGTSAVRKVMDGRANLVELSVAGPGGKIEGVSLRLYDPTARQWKLHFASIADGQLTPPAIGGFVGDHGEFYAQDSLRGRAIFVRFVIDKVDARTWRFVQAFSDDGGKTWEPNWIATDTRIADAPARN